MNILVVSDGHEGDYVGLWLPSFEIEGGKWVPNKAQKYLQRCWDDAMQWLPGKFDIVFLNGDMVAGENLAEQGARLVTSDTMEQVNCAVERLKPLRDRADQFRVLRGTPYHEGKKTPAAEPLAKAIGADKWKNGAYSGYWYRKVHAGHIIDVTHHLPAALVYKSTMLEREGSWALRNREKDLPILLIRSHLHEFHRHDTDNTVEIITPCWQMQGPYGIKRSPNKMFPDLGLVWIEIEEGKEENEVHIHKRLYKHPMWHTE